MTSKTLSKRYEINNPKREEELEKHKSHIFFAFEIFFKNCNTNKSDVVILNKLFLPHITPEF